MTVAFAEVKGRATSAATRQNARVTIVVFIVFWGFGFLCVLGCFLGSCFSVLTVGTEWSGVIGWVIRRL